MVFSSSASKRFSVALVVVLLASARAEAVESEQSVESTDVYQLSGGIYRVDAISRSLLASPPAGLSGGALAVGGDGRIGFALLVGPGYPSTAAAISTIDLVTGAILRTASLPPPCFDVALTADAMRVFVSCQEQLLVLDSANLAIANTVTFPGGADSLDVTPDGRWLYAHGGAGLAVLAADTLQLRTRFATHGSPTFNQTGTLAYVVGEGEILMIDVGRHVVLARAPLPYPIGPVTISLDGRSLHYGGGHGIYELDPISLGTKRSVRLSTYAGFLALSPDGTKLYATTGGRDLTVLDTASLTVLSVRPETAGRLVSARSPELPLLFVNGVAGSYASTTALVAKVSGEGVAGNSIEFHLNSQSMGTAITDSLGLARLENVSLAGLQAGNYPHAVAATLAGDGNRGPSTVSAGLHVHRAIPEIAWSPGTLMAGTALGPAQLNATTAMSGTFTYTPPAGTVLGLGSHHVQVTFTPDDPANVTAASTARLVQAETWSDASDPVVLQCCSRETVIAVDPLADRRFVSDNGRIMLVEGATGVVLDESVWLGEYVGTAAFDSDGRKLFAGVSFSNVAGWNYQLVVLDSDTLAVIETISLANPITDLAFNGASGILYVDTFGAGPLLALDFNRSSTDPARTTQISQCVYSYSFALNIRAGYLYLGCDEGVAAIDVDPSRVDTFHQSAGFITDGAATAVATNPVEGLVYAGLPSRSIDGEYAVPEILVIDGNPGSPSFHEVLRRQPIDYPPPADPIVGQTWAYALALGYSPIVDRLYVNVAHEHLNDGIAFLAVYNGAVTAQLSLTLLPSQGDLLVHAPANTVWLGGTVAVRDTVVLEAATPVSSSATTTETTAAAITFTSVSSSGITSVEPIAPEAQNLSLPGQYSVDGASAYEITTTAQTSGPITLCFRTAADDPDVFGALRVLHGENGGWVDRTTSRDYASGVICATVTSLSPFVIARHTASYDTRFLFDQQRAFRAGSTAPIRLQVIDPSGANVSSPVLPVRRLRLTRVSTAAGSGAQDAGRANPDGEFRYDPALGSYIFNLKTTGLASGEYAMSFRIAGDTRVHELTFRVR